MKYIVAAALTLVAVGGAVSWMHMRPQDAAAEARRYAVEPETKVRPARFEDMKWHAPAEMRAPASATEK